MRRKKRRLGAGVGVGVVGGGRGGRWGCVTGMDSKRGSEDLT